MNKSGCEYKSELERGRKRGREKTRWRAKRRIKRSKTHGQCVTDEAKNDKEQRKERDDNVGAPVSVCEKKRETECDGQPGGRRGKINV